jgi:hypothetical protein
MWNIYRVVSDDESESEISEEEDEEQEIVNGGEEEEADDEASDMEEQELGECRYVVTRKRGITQQRGNDTQTRGGRDHQQRLEEPATRRQEKVRKKGSRHLNIQVRYGCTQRGGEDQQQPRAVGTRREETSRKRGRGDHKEQSPALKKKRKKKHNSGAQ